ncbi:glycosyltransferase family 2 protein [Enterobacteriaceae bacterium H18W14]|uniref:glycosyltransferase family 2 protein n=1 Tax=Dryocola boscaweniae TaxID=2925397 RepID=UPI0022F0B3BF|nr:glycosyltransferase family 2 protein [Dryocola boscaweniae]MCT4717361.1 glycosyltransferase family 2 protein [Dryocola boscaweniae]
MDVTITAALIVKDEERCIKRCLQSICHIFDEIIIVDTGSFDSTIEIIKDFNCNIINLFQIRWVDDFSYARNIAISKSTSKYVFFIDADEYLFTSRDKMLLEFAKIDKSDFASSTTYCPKIINHDNNNLRNVQRIFLNNGEFYYYGYVHEEIRHKKNITIKNVEIDIKVYHDGYLDEVVKTKNKIKRNIFLNHRNINNEPGNLRWQYFYYRDAFSELGPKKVFEMLSRSVGIHPGSMLDVENIKNDIFFFATLDLLAQSLLITMDNHRDFKLVISAMREIIPKNSNAMYYELIHDILNYKILAKKRIGEILKYKKTEQPHYNGMLHSEGLHIDAALSFYLYEVGLIRQSERLLRSVENNGFRTQMTSFYLKNIKSMSRGEDNER